MIQLNSAHILIPPILDEMYLFCKIKFYNYIRADLIQTRDDFRKKLDLTITNEDYMSTFPYNLNDVVLNLSHINLNRTELEALSVGPKFSIPPRKIDQLVVGNEFECLYDQFKDL